MDKYTIKIISIYIKNYKNIKSGYINLSDSSNVSYVMNILSLFREIVLDNRLPTNCKETILTNKEEMSLILKLSISKNDKESFIAVYSFTFLNKEKLMKKESLKVAEMKDNGEYSKYYNYFNCSLNESDYAARSVYNYQVKIRKMKSSYALVPSSKYGQFLLFTDVIYEALEESRNIEAFKLINILNIIRSYVINLKL